MAEEIKAKFQGDWKVYKSEKFEAFVDALGVGFIKKKMMLNVSPSMKVSVDGETITITISVGPKTNNVSFKLGEEFESDGEMPGKRLFTYADGKLTTQITPKDAKSQPQRVERELINGEIVQTMTIGSVECKRYFKKA